MRTEDVRLETHRLSHQTIRLILVLLPIWVLGAGELTQFASKNTLPGPLERTGLVKGRDFVQFYVAGSLAREGRWVEIYDISALKEAVAQTVPPARGIVPAPVYPPHVAVFFSPWGALPYLVARWLWFAASAIAYLAGTGLLIRRIELSREHKLLAWLTAILNPALAMALTTGQLSAVAMLAWALAFSAHIRGRTLLCGVCLGLLAYKPPLLIGVLLVLMVTGAWTMLAGVMISGVAQTCAAVIVSGAAPWLEYVRSLSAFPRYYYLTDTLPHQKQSLLGFFQLLLGSGAPALGLSIVAGIGVLVLWRRHRTQTGGRWFMPMLAASSVLLSPHFYVYDLLVLTPALLMVAGALASANGTVAERVLGWSSYVLLYAPYSGAIALHGRVQLSTIALSTFLIGVHRLWLSEAPSARA